MRPSHSGGNMFNRLRQFFRRQGCASAPFVVSIIRLGAVQTVIFQKAGS